MVKKTKGKLEAERQEAERKRVCTKKESFNLRANWFMDAEDCSSADLGCEEIAGTREELRAEELRHVA